MSKKLITARREVERLRMEAAGAVDTDVKIWEAGNRVSDLERDERESAVRTARRAALVMDAVLLVVAVLTMGFSLQNIHDFAASHGVQDPIAWFLAPAVDLALVAALIGDAVLSRHQLDAGPWATRLRWYAGAATLTLNAWEAVASLDAAAIVLHVVPPVLLFVLAEAASPYRVRFADTVRLAAAATVEAEADTAPVSTPAPAEVDTTPDAKVPEVYDQEAEPAVSTMTPQVEKAEPLRSVPAPAEVSTPGDRLDAKAARAAIEAAWEAGLTIREAATRATRSASYVGGVYASIMKARGPQPIKGQTAIEGEAA
ncbi:hypothetical protein ACQRET_33365 [Streptomyces koyangensis]|uniref:hypothetical protein n=1 Tax=Streptomyces koyangensis TaxID=188770 RepID=UPI003D06D483